MGQQQLLLIILGAIVVGIMVFVGMTTFDAHSVQANKDALTSSMQNIAADAYQYKMRPKAFGGGNPSYAGYTVPNKMLRDDNGSYAVSGSILSTQIVFSGTSVINSAWVATMTVDDSGKAFVSYVGW
ncbi:MAG TPA: hypothetical protein VI215_11255 [Bacteroidota bacterium]|jgi:hypothetical protein